MSEELKRKLYDYEVEPPEIMWNRIDAALDDEVNAEFPQKLYELEATPPADVWKRIEEELESDKEHYPAKLYDIEVVPPARTWDKITASLDEGITIRRLSTGRIIPFVRYAVAACLIGLVAFGAFKLLNQKTVDKSVAAKTISPQKDSSVPVNPPSEIRDEQLPPAPDNNLPDERPRLAQVEIKQRKKISPEQAAYMSQMAAATLPTFAASKPGSDFRQASLKGDIPGNCSAISDADPYLMFVNPDGYLIRISKKLAETLGCVYTNGNSDDNNRCQDQIKKWRDKIAQSPATSSPDNFMDILNVIKSVQE